ncbi:fibronectin type III domain-containing protein [Colletotrichum karsti]|uniref:Fibronectin type III domain-containing protein n=1 Tax=Colletotrichum karsti TaxID=1095194 RepID=A0A9P6HWE8_9PEZI|nr:fibronectin type III domain-containing protein [Colletotrichum karsti]KAF9872073.1 fibronectin type III domain-containing protein [Colletotrichum karsti]
MIAGDSMSHGQEGDFTWRYRLWQWLRQEQVNFEFVGPCSGTKKRDKSQPPSPPPFADEPPPKEAPDPCAFDGGGYADGVQFGSCHLSRWGKQAAQCVDEVNQQIARFEPDYLLVFLGFNDLGWGVSGPETLIDVMKRLVHNARDAKPSLKLAIANIPQRTPIDGTEHLAEMVDTYNKQIPASISAWDSKESSARLVKVREAYDCFAGSYDGIHPNALGEFQIAKAFSQVLVSEFGIGAKELSVPPQIPKRPTPVPKYVAAKAVSYGIAVTWDHVYGAIGYDVRSRNSDDSEWDYWRKTSNRHDTMNVQDGVKYEYQIRTYNGESSGEEVTSEWSPVAAAVASPKAAPGPTDIIVTPGVSELVLEWQQPYGQWIMDRYEVQVFDASAFLTFPLVRGVRGNRDTISNDELISGHRYAVLIRAWTQEGPGSFATGRNFIAGHGRPIEPMNLQAETTDSVTAKLTWKPSQYASSYRVWVRKYGEEFEFDVDGETEDTEYGVTFLIPGAWNFEFSVSAFNGNLESPKSGSVVPPRREVEL